jgi:hypothetical protein
MSKFDDEVNKILFEAEGFLGGLSDVARGVGRLAKGVGGLAANMLGSKLTFAKPIENFLKDNPNTKTTSTSTNTNTNNNSSKDLSMEKISKFIFELKKITQDAYKTTTSNDFSLPKNKNILIDFLTVNEKLTLKEFVNLIFAISKRSVSNLNNIIADAGLKQFSNVDITKLEGPQDNNAYIKWLYSLHKTETYNDVIEHLVNLLTSFKIT